MLIFDAHLDLAFNAVEWNRDLRMDVRELRALEHNLGYRDAGRCTGTVTFPELKRAEVRLGVATLFARYEPNMNHAIGYSTVEACHASAHAQLAYYRAMERSGWIRMIQSRQQLRNHAELCRTNLNEQNFGFILSMECADAVLEPAEIHDWHKLGLRAIGMTHYGANRYGGGTRNELGLTLDGIELLRQIESLGMVLDLTHLSDRSFEQVRKHFGGRVLASHQNARKFCDWQRQFSDEQIRFVIEKKGVLGMAYDAVMLQPEWVRGTSHPTVTQERVAENIDHICQMAGNALHVGIGSDLDGGYGFEQTPADVNTIADIQKLVPILERRGYSTEAIAGIFHGNWLRFFGEVLA